MCGFAGEFTLSAGRASLDLAVAMARQLAHRGPDEQGAHLCADGRCAMGFRRLAVLDLQGSHQPMISPDGKVALSFNGEIYNFRALRADLVRQGAVFATSGDTEVVLQMYLRYGREMLQRLEGMFAIAVYDARTALLLLARDRMGEKPLWYARLADRIVFASEAKAILAHPNVCRELDKDSILHYLSFGYVPAPRSVWRNIYKILPSHYLEVSQSEVAAQYWRPTVRAISGLAADAIAQARQEVQSAVAERMAADVPLGALLSGGMDSSIMVACMAKAAGAGGGIRTFTAGFEDSAFDERPAARIVAEHYRTQHTELLVRAQPGPAMLDLIVDHYDEPFADSSAIATYLICQAAREHVTVALAGDGGDEVFAGYDRYRAIQAADAAGPGKYLAARLAAPLLRLIAPHDERNVLRRLSRFADALPLPVAMQYFTYRRLFNPQDLGRLIRLEWLGDLDLEGPAAWFVDLFEQPDVDDEVARAQLDDMATYLPDDLLVKTDIASMAHSLELRSPLLASRLVDFGLSLPPELKIAGRRGKAILRQAFADSLPAAVFNRPKRGFALPLGQWLRNEMLDTVHATILSDSFLSCGIVQPEAVVGLVNDHVAGRGDHRHRIWALMVLARWLAKQTSK